MRRVIRPLVAALVAILACAGPASAASRHHQVWRTIIRLIPLPGGGTIIHVHGAGHGRMTVLSRDTIAAAAVRDIDADGDLDIIASGGQGLVVWHNLGAGRYALAPSPAKRSLDRRSAPGIAAARESDRTSGISEERQQLAAENWPLTARVTPAVCLIPSVTIRVHCPAADTHAGRAPPARA
jgi:hypothetical protein